MDEARDYLVALQSYLPPDIRRLPEERQLEYLSELLSHHHRHHRYRSLFSETNKCLPIMPMLGTALHTA